MNLRDIENALSKLRSNNSHKENMDIDTDLLWQRVQPHIPQKKPKGFPKYVILIIALVFMVGLFGVIRHYQVTVDETLSSEIIIDDSADARGDNTITDTDVNTNQETATKLNSEEIGTVASTSNSISGETYPSLGHAELAQEDIVKKDAAKGQNKAEGLAFAQRQNINIANKDKGSTLNNSDYSNKGNISFQFGNEDAVYPDFSSTTNVASNNTPESTQQGYSSDSRYKFQTKEDGSRLYTQSNQNISQSSPKSIGLQDNSFSLKTLSLLPSMLSPMHLEDPLLKEALPKNQSYLITSKPRFYIELGAGIFLSSKMMKLTNTELQEHFNNRKKAEITLEAWNTSMAISYEVVPKFRIRIGLDYTILNETSRAEITTSELTTLENVTIGNLVRVDGTIEPIYGDVEVNRTVSKSVTRANSYRLISIPLELIYATQGNKLDTEFGIGIYQNISQSNSGFWHPNGTLEYNLNTDTEGYLKDRIGTSLTTHVGLAYHLSSSLSLYGRVRINQQLSSITQVDYGIEQKYLLLGAEIGVRTHF